MRLVDHVRTFWLCSLAAGALALFSLTAAGTARAADDEHVLDLGAVSLNAPEKWVRKMPKSRIVAYEFAAPAAEGDDAEGRFTIMAAGGGVKANLERWYGQFTQPDGGSTADRAKNSEKKVAGQDVYLVDIAGTYLDKPSPFAPGPAIERENYRMLGAVIATQNGDIYLKFYGPAKTIETQSKAFQEMVDGLRAK
ncbi:MAG: hypothetical protein KF708_10015 [Pirellulales bacterium]|nr:hypothetical protein [Pirellulales bacterium]